MLAGHVWASRPRHTSRFPQLIVYRKGKPRPHDTLQIESSRLAVRAGSPQERILERLRKTVVPKLKWIATAPSAADPLDDVADGQADYALVDAREFSFCRHQFIQISMSDLRLPDARPVQWIVRRGAPGSARRVNQFFASLIQLGRARRACT